MARFLKEKKQTIGQVPGELLFIGEQRVAKPTAYLMSYDQNRIVEDEFTNFKDGLLEEKVPAVSWINLNGLHDTEVVRQLGRSFELHALTLEDILNTGQRPKIVEYDHYLFLVLKTLKYNAFKKQVESEQLSIVIGSNFLITFQEGTNDIFEAVRERIRRHKGRIRQSGTDYLAYALLDTVVDHYLLTLENIGAEIERLEKRIIDDPTPDLLDHINAYKREMNYLKKTIRPYKEAIIQLNKLDNEMVAEQTRPFLRDLLDLATQATESIDTYKEILADDLDIYNTGLNNHLNEIIKFLTIFSTVFIPLTFVAGIYGTNFEYLPELKFKYSYFIFWGVLILIAGGMIAFFKKRKWL